MPLSSELVPFQIRRLPGMNNKGDPLEFQDQFVLTAQNCRFDPEPGGVTKREPLYYFNTVSIASLAMTSLYRYYKSDGTSVFVATNGTNVYVGDDTSGTFASIRSSMTTGKRYNYITYNDLLIGTNGYDNMFVYDGGAEYVTWELGSCKTWTGASNANMTNTSTAQYAVTMDSDAYVCGAVSNVLTVTGCNIDLSYIPLGPSGTTDRKIYRKSAETGGDFRLIATISDNSTTTFTDNTVNASALTVMPAVTDDMPLGCKLELYRERMFVACDPSYPNRIYFSKPYLPGYIQQSTNLDYLDISPDDNDEISAIPVFLGNMVCIKKNTIRKLHVSGPQSGWYAEDPFVHAGSPAKWSIAATPYGIAYLGWDHWYMFDGANSVPIIDEFDTYDILSANYDDTVAFYWENELLAAYTVTERAQQYHDRVMRYNFKRKALNVDLMNVNCFAAKRGDAETGELYFGGSVNGYVYKGVEEDMTYKITSKSDLESGDQSDIYVGGTETDAYIEIGSDVTASSIPTNLIILWDGEEHPGETDWTEITGFNDRFLRIGSTASLTGNMGVSVDMDAQATTSSTQINYVYLNAYYKNSTTTINELPVGSILLWEDAAVPAGYYPLDPNQYIKINNNSVGTTGTETIWINSGTGSGLDNYIKVNVIKKVGSAGTWDGSTQYCYSPCYSGTLGSSGWQDATGTYSNCHIQSGWVDITEYNGGDSDYAVDSTGRSEIASYSYYQGFTSNSGTLVTNEPNNGEGENSIDGSFDTCYGDERTSSQYGSGSHNYDDISAMHTFDEPTTLERIKYRMYARGWNSGNYYQEHDYYLTVQYSTSSAGWTNFTGAYYSGSGGGNSDTTLDTGTVTKTQQVTDVRAIRAYVHCHAGCAEGSWGIQVRIYELRAYTKPYGWVSFPLGQKILGKMDTYNGAWVTSSATQGTWTSQVAEINADTMLRLYWNESLTGTDDAQFYFRTGATAAACTTASWSSAYTDPNGVSISNITANVWAQFKVVLTATDTTVSNPKIYSADGYVMKYTYSKGETAAESAVEFIYELGFRHFQAPMLDKIFKKIYTEHEGTEGSFILYWDTENTTNSSFTISLGDYPKRWESYFPSDAFGKQMNIKIYKNDLYDFKLKEIKGVFTPEPLVV